MTDQSPERRSHQGIWRDNVPCIRKTCCDDIVCGLRLVVCVALDTRTVS